MKILTMVLSLAVVFLMVSVAALGSASTQTQSFAVPLALSVFIPCANLKSIYSHSWTPRRSKFSRTEER